MARVVFNTVRWKNRLVEYPRRYKETEQDGSILHTPDPGIVAEAGTPLNAQNMNRIEQGIADCAAAVNGKASQMEFTATIPMTGWTGNETDGYTRSITVTGMLATDTPIIDVNLGGRTLSQIDAILDAWACVVRISTSAGRITVLADDIPAAAIPIQGRCIRNE